MYVYMYIYIYIYIYTYIHTIIDSELVAGLLPAGGRLGVRREVRGPGNKLNLDKGLFSKLFVYLF